MAENEENPGSSIDNIPYEILNQIISLIPLKEATRTIILSSSWKHLWTPLQVFLNINSDQTTSQQSGQQMNHFISSFLNTYQNSYQILNLSLIKPKGHVVGDQETLFLKAIKGVNKELYITFHGEIENPKVFGLSIELSLCENDHFCSLKTLHLRSITSRAGSFLPALFSSCRNLETLSLEKCSGLQYIDLKAHDSLLKKFVVLDCEKMASVTISSAPKLKCFLYRGTLVKIVFKDVPNLCDVTLNLKGTFEVAGDHGDFDSCEDDLVPLLASLKDIEVLTLSGWLLEWLCTRETTFDDVDFKFDKLKDLSWIDGCMNEQKRDSLACFLSLTPSLENLFIKIDEKWSPLQSPHFHRSWPQIRTAKSQKDSHLEHLKMVKFFGFKIEEENQNLIWLMDFLLKKAITIKKMSVTTPENKVSWWVSKVPQSHLKKMASTTSSCNSSKSPLILSLNHKCCFQLTAVNDNDKFML
ncbi:hypothetical protein L6452_24478 [Arctium lappa]|uniref:Uncharacterized protein n=1 Tax=Arctium lappa TaxID=4217 RepID=A0ACB9A9J6_ARCLA|nr:hypothetical protein L6452_24478 [Arctium lappa]